MAKIHYHSDCNFFAGCENMLVNFLTSPELNSEYELSFSFRYSPLYWSQFQQRVKTDVPVYALHIPDQMIFGTYGVSVVGLFTKLMSNLFAIFASIPIIIIQFIALYNLLKKIKPDILHLNNGGYPAALSPRVAVFVAKLLRIPNIIFVVNNVAVDYKRPSRWIHYFFDQFISRWVTCFVTGSEFASLKLRDVLKISKEKSLSIHNGINLRSPNEGVTETRKRLGLEKFSGTIFATISILRENKGHSVLLRAIQKLITRNYENKSKAKFIIEGEGVLRDELEAYVVENSLEGICLFVGNEPNIMNIMNLMDVMVFPSLSNEDFPNVILESMGFGKPIISSRIAGTPEQIQDNVNGLLVEPGNVDQLSMKIESILNRPDKINTLGKNGKELFLEKYTHVFAVNNYMNLYESILKEKK
ncbi:glycosyltransferase [Leptospira kanakyensis]|uniref:glycosyltransferase n=1 Tax=Leptospira kanakyensis TaxID=2484968 RepID=UPI00223D05AB|nr:glycosyltransferase [Leptospira kanakyensis]MCW7471388.1 glycosyltransferase [Leptospira kanakyensis]